MLCIFLAETTALEPVFDAALTLAPPARRAHVLRLRQPEEQRRSLAAGLLLRAFLGVERDEQLVYGPVGKPALAAGGPEFSLSHSGNYAALAVSDRPVGIDLEQVRSFPDAVFRRQFSPAEQDWAGADDLRRFLVWTRKEALMKADGAGLTLEAAALPALPEGDGAVTVGGVRRYFSALQYDGHAVSLAAETPEAPAFTLCSAAQLLKGACHGTGA